MAVAVPGPDPAAHSAALLFERHYAAVFGYCSWRLRTSFDAEEAAQTTFARALAALRRGHRPRNERAWLVTIARNVCTTLGTAPHRTLEIAGDVPHGVSPDIDDGLDPELEAALAALPEGQRRALLLREWHELSYREIAAELGVGVATVESWIFRARRSLASALGGARRQLGLTALLRSVGSGTGAKVAATAVLATAVVATERAVVPERSDRADTRPAQAQTASAGVRARADVRARVASASAAPAVAKRRTHAPKAPATEHAAIMDVPSRGAGGSVSEPAKPSAPTADPRRDAQPDSPAPSASAAPAPAPPVQEPTLPVEPPALPPVEAPSLPPVEAPSLPPVEAPSLPPVEAPSLPPVETSPLPVATPEVPALPSVTAPLDPVAVPSLP